MKTFSCKFKAGVMVTIKVFFALAIAAMTLCTGDTSLSGGSGTGVGNGAVLIGKVMNNDSLPVTHALVRLRTDMYLADTSGRVTTVRNDTLATTATDNQGFFTIDSVRLSKVYCIEILDTIGGHDSGAFYRVDLSKDTLSDTVRLMPRIVRQTKILNGTIVLNGLPGNAYVQFYGLERVGRTDSKGSFKIEQLPPPVECERNECEYKVKITVILSDKSVKVYNSELEIRFDSNQNILNYEFELEDD